MGRMDGRLELSQMRADMTRQMGNVNAKRDTLLYPPGMSLISKANPFQRRPSEYAGGMTPTSKQAPNDWADVNPANNITLDALNKLKDALAINLGIQIGGTVIRVQGYDDPRPNNPHDTISFTEWQNNTFQQGNAMNAYISFVPDSDWVNAAQFKAKLELIGQSQDPWSGLLGYLESLWSIHGRNREAIQNDILRNSPAFLKIASSAVAATGAGQPLNFAPFR